MRRSSNLNYFRKLTSFVLFFCVLSGAFSIGKAQTKLWTSEKGIQDTSKNLANGYFADSKMNYRALRYTESNYAPGEMMCDKRIVMTPQTMKMKIVRTAAAARRS